MTQTTFNEMINKMKNGKIYGIFHNDLDGYGCGKVASSYVNLVEGKYLNYAKTYTEIENYCNETYKNYDGLIVADLNLDLNSLERLNKLAGEGYAIMYFDHHFKSTEQIEFFKNSDILFDYDKEYCATYIMFKHFVSYGYATNTNRTKMAEIVDMIDAWDMFKWKNSETYEVVNEKARDLNTYFKYFGSEKTLEKIDNYVNDKFDRLFSSIEFSNIRFINKTIRNAIIDKSKNIVTMEYPFEDEVYKIGITFYAEKDVSEIGNGIAELNPDLAFIVIIDMVHNSVNFRSVSVKPNLAKVAALYGGGGHPKAAGCNLDQKAFNDFVIGDIDGRIIETIRANKVNKRNVSSATNISFSNDSVEE